MTKLTFCQTIRRALPEPDEHPITQPALNLLPARLPEVGQFAACDTPAS
jgi:hypothetical protein